MRRYLPFLIIVGVLLIALGAGAVLFRYRNQPPLRPTYGRPGAEPPHIRGDARALVQLEEFGDFECPPCSVLWATLQKLEHDYGKRLSVVFRQHPLKMHHFARDAARAAEAAGLQGHFWEMHDMLYKNRPLWAAVPDVRPILNGYAGELGLNVERFKADLDGESVAKRLAADENRGESLGVDRTPVIFVNGEPVPYAPNPEPGLRAAIDKALAAKRR